MNYIQIKILKLPIETQIILYIGRFVLLKKTLSKLCP